MDTLLYGRIIKPSLALGKSFFERRRGFRLRKASPSSVEIVTGQTVFFTIVKGTGISIADERDLGRLERESLGLELGVIVIGREEVFLPAGEETEEKKRGVLEPEIEGVIRRV